MDPRIDEILRFWFEPAPEGDDRPSGVDLWFGKSVRVDRAIERSFGKLVEAARAGQLAAWTATGRGRLALILLLDQFPRNIHRDSPEAFASDEKALALCLDGLDEGVDLELTPPERAFFYMPAMHSEDPDIQMTSVEIFSELAKNAPSEHAALCKGFLQHARRHHEVVERFERFPQRNGILGRSSTPDEATFLQQSDEL
jgi:uncharacterized protein (DUF924 family)